MCRSRLLLAYFNPSHTSLRSIAFDDRFGLCFTPFQIGLCYEFQNRSGDVSFCEINDRGMDYYVCYIRFFALGESGQLFKIRRRVVLWLEPSLRTAKPNWEPRL